MFRSHDDSPAELESQIILRLPAEPAKILRDLIATNANLKDRFTVKIDDDMRHGEVRVDHHVMHAKVVDLPTVVESLKTIDGRGFYKTADICQMMLCRDGEDHTTDDDSPVKVKKKDSIKVEKKYLWPHGLTPPTKNVRKRRFRKTLKKKYVEAPEIEKEVKRLLRIDNDAVSVKWEVINEDDDHRHTQAAQTGTVVIKKEPQEPGGSNVAEHEIFGGAVSDSEEEDAHLNVLELDENSQNSADDSHLTDSNSMMQNTIESKLLTEFSSEMFRDLQNPMIPLMEYYQPPSVSYASQNLSRGAIETRLAELDVELADVRNRRIQEENKVDNIENHALRQRFQDILDRLQQEQIDKEQEQYELHELLKQTP